MEEQETPEDTGISPDEAFAAVGDSTRVEILRVLAISGPHSFSELFECVDYNTESNFTYHLDRLQDHFVRKDDGAYEITQPGRRIVEAIRSGAVTEAPIIERTAIDQRCHFCGGQVEVEYYDERLERFCSECDGMWNSRPEGFLGSLSLPPIGLENRTIDEVTRAAWVKRNLELYSIAAELCPRCSGRLALELVVCDDHDADDDLCPHCGHRYPGAVLIECGSCGFDSRGSVALSVLPELPFIRMIVSQNQHPVLPASIASFHRCISDFEMEVESIDPPAIRMRFTTDEEPLTFLVDDGLDPQLVEATGE